MKKIILTFLFIGLYGITVAQKRYSISPSRILSEKAEFGMYTNFKIYQDNISNDTIVLKWKLISDNLIKGWDYSSCAYGICYAFIPDTLCTMSPIIPRESGFLSLTIDPMEIKGTGTASIYVYDSANPSVKDTITFIINAESANGINSYELTNALSVYPNPATEMIYIKNDPVGSSNASIQIKNILGKEVYNGWASSNDANVVDVRTFSEGMYFVRCDYGNGTFSIKKIQIIK